MALFPKSDYNYEIRIHPRKQKYNFLSLTKARTISDDWDEIREKLVALGTDIYNKINESNL